MHHEATISQPYQYQIKRHFINLLYVLFGSVILAISAQLSIPLPFTPVPLSMQTLAISILAMTLGPHRAFFSVVAYLVQATFGLPVLAGGSINPLWMLGPTSGYLIGFAISAYVMGMLLQGLEKTALLKVWLILSINEIIIISCGTIGIAILFGFDKALSIGLLPFIPNAIVKICLATSIFKPIQWIKFKS